MASRGAASTAASAYSTALDALPFNSAVSACSAEYAWLGATFPVHPVSAVVASAVVTASCTNRLLVAFVSMLILTPLTAIPRRRFLLVTVLHLGSEACDFRHFGEQRVERIGHQLLRTAAAHRTGQSQHQMAFLIEPERESCSLAL